MGAVFKKEIGSYFKSMTGYVFLSFFLFMTSVLFLLINVSRGTVYYQYVISSSTMTFLIIIPMLTMKAYSQEAKDQTDQLLFTSPVSIAKITLGKYFAAVSLFSLALIITFVFPIILACSYSGSLPVAQIAGTYFGYFLLGCCFISVGIFLSTFSDNLVAVSISTFAVTFAFCMLDNFVGELPSGKNFSAAFLLAIVIYACYMIYKRAKSLVAAVVAFVMCAGGLAFGYFKDMSLFDGAMRKVLLWFSLLYRFDNFGQGVLNLSDVVYYLSFITLFLFLTINKLERRKG